MTYEEALRKAKRLEWITVVKVIITVLVVSAVSGESQAMRAAWIEDGLAIIPSVMFLIAARVASRPVSERFPYGFHRAYGIAHLISGAALLFMGSLLVYNSAVSLIDQEKPPIGLVVLFGHALWAGWLMVLVMFISVIPPFILGRLKMKLAPVLHDKVLYSDADMNKADWTTGLGTIVGVLGIGIGLWWMDAVAAALIGLSIVRDGIFNVKAAATDLMDTRVTTFDERVPHLLTSLDTLVASTPWVMASESRVRDQGHFFHCETFVVPRSGYSVSVADLDALRSRIHELDWKLHDVVVAPVSTLPSERKSQTS